MKDNKLIYFVLTIISFLLFSCANNVIDSNPSRSISSTFTELSCREMLERFLPSPQRVSEGPTTIKIKTPSSLTSANHTIAEMGTIERNIEVEASDLFTTFSKETKDLAVKGAFKMLVDPQESLMARIMLIRNAKKTIDLTYYIFQDSEASKIIIGELSEALRRGVNVRLMVDELGSIGAAASFFKEIQVLNHVIGGNIFDDSGNVVGKASFQAVVINPIFNIRSSIKEWYYKVTALTTGKAVQVNNSSILHRSHDKILLVDAGSPADAKAIIGGRNISNHYYKIGEQEDRNNIFSDLDILVKGISYVESTDDNEVVRNALLEHFNRLYFYSANKKFVDFIFKIGRGKAAETLRSIRNTRNSIIRYRHTELAQTLKKMEAEDYLNKNFDKGHIAFVNEIENLIRKDPLGNLSYNNGNSIMKNIREQVEKAQDDILICSPYIYLTDKEIEFFASWLKQDSKRTLRIITNSSATSDSLFAQSIVESFVMPKLLAKLKENGIPKKQYEVLAYGNLDNKELGGSVTQGKLHAKFWMIDNFAIGVGTSNFDPLSRLTNSEIAANVFPTDGHLSVDTINDYYLKLKDSSTLWGSEQFYNAKFRPELKTKLMIQSFVAKIIDFFKILPQEK